MIRDAALFNAVPKEKYLLHHLVGQKIKKADTIALMRSMKIHCDFKTTGMRIFF